MCFQREGGEPVPGCLNGDLEKSKTDYCVALTPRSPADTARPSPSPPSPMTAPPTVTQSQAIQQQQLRLYWELGYNWQDEYFERKWCMMWEYDGHPRTGMCWYGLEERPCNPDEVYVSKCSADPRQRFDLILLPSHEGIEETFMIKVPSKDSCLQLNTKAIHLRPCDEQSPLQHWTTINGSVSGKRFEIVPVARPTHCVTQDHHPKAAEVITLQRCSIARSPLHLTSFWTLYP